MDPYLLTRIGDVTIQRVLPKQDAPTKETSAEHQVTPSTESPATELDLSARNPTSIDKREDEGGGESDKSPDYSDASDEDDGDISQMEDEDDDQNVPLSLVTKRNQINSLPLASNSSITITPLGASAKTVKQDESKHSDVKMAESGEQGRSAECKSVQENKDASESEDDDDLPLSRLLAEVQSVPADFVVDEAFGRELDKTEGSVEKPMNEDAFEDAEPESGEEAEEGVEGEGRGMTGKGQEQGSGDEDPEREMIVVKQEPLEEGEEDELGSKRKMVEGEDDSEETSTKKSKKDSGKESGSESDTDNNSQSGIDKKNAEKKLVNLRKNIREVMDEAQLDEATLAAQRQEMERLQRVQEQQRIIREVNRQINLNRQNSKTQSRVISLLQSGGTSLLKASPNAAAPKGSSSPNTVLVKLGSGAGPPQVVNKKVLEILRSTKTTPTTTSTSKAAALATKLLNKTQSLTPSVSIAPVKTGLTITKMGKAAAAAEDEKVPGAKARGRMKQKGKDDHFVMISSSSSDEDDCILISEPSDGEEEEEDEDPTNSGMHTNDLYNVPDDQGRVLINVGRPENEPDVFLAPQIARIIKPHQIGGVRFLFDNVVESLERFKTSTGFGCILAHSMGLGKTLQVVSFCDVFLRYTTGKSVLCIMPINTLQNWVAEFNMWLPVDPANSPFSAHGEVQPRMFPIFVLNDLQKTMVARAKVVAQWASEGGVLMIGYELYRQLALQKPRKRRGTSKRKVNPDDDVEDEKNKQLLEEVYAALVKPGPDLVICDEGHRIKNSHASISNALKQIRSKRRVVLTGYPLQNNLVEYWCMVDFVRPNYLGSKTEFSNMFERPIQNGQCIDSTPQDIRLMRYRAHVLHSLLEGFVQRRSHAVLTNALPQKAEYVILVRLTKFQRTLYDTFMNEVVRTKAVPNPLKAFAVCCKIWNHPDVLYDFLKRRTMGTEAVDLDLEETAGAMAPLVPTGGSTAPPMMGLGPNIVLPTKRPRGRSPKALSSSPGRRDRRSANKKRGGAEPDSPVKSPMVAAVMPNTSSGSQPVADPQMTQQADVKPMTQARYPAVPPNPHYPGYPQTNDYQNAPPSYPGFNNQQGFNNQNMYSNFGGGSYQSSYQDPNFNGGNYWNSNPPYYNEHSNPGMYAGYNESDPGAPNYYNQDMMGTDGYMGPRGYNGGMGMNRGMSGMNQMQQGRMGMNNSSHGMMPPMNSGLAMNSMGMPAPGNNMNPNTSMNQNNYGMNSMGMNQMGPQGSGMMSQNMGMNQTQGMGMGMMAPQGHGGMNVPSTQGMGMSGQSSGFGMGLDSNRGQSSSHNPSSGGMHTMTDSQVNLMTNTSNQSSAESQQQAAIENIANNLMMSSQQSLKSTTGLIGGGESRNTQNLQPKLPSRPSTHDITHHGPAEILGEGPLPPFGTSGLNNAPSLLGGIPNQLGMQQSPTNMMNSSRPQNSRNYPTSTITSAQSHVMENMVPRAQASPNIADSQNSSGMLGYESSHGNQPLSSAGHHAHMVNQTPSNPQNMGNHPNQPFHPNQGHNTQNMMGNAPNPMFRHQQPNQAMFGQQGSMSMMDSTGMYGNNQPLPHMMGGGHNPIMNQHLMTNQNVIGSGGMTALDHTNLNNQPLAGNQQLSSSQNQILGNPDPIYSTSTITSQQNMGSQDSHGGYNQHSYGNQNTSNPMGNLQNMLNSQSIAQGKPQADVGPIRDQNHQSLMPINSPAQSSVPATPGGVPQSDAMMGHNMVPNQHNPTNPASSLIDNQPNMYGMSQPGYMNNQSMINPAGRNPPGMQPMMGGSQNMGMVMNNSPAPGMYGSHMNPHDMNSGMMGNQMPNPSFNQNQMGCGNNMMGSYNQPGMNYPGSMMGNQMSNYGMSQQGMTNPNSFGQSQTFGNNASRSQPDLGMRNPPSGGLNPDINQAVNNNFGNNQGSFGTFGNNMASNSFNLNQNNQASNKAGLDSFQSNSNSITNSRFMSGGEFQTGNSQSSTQDLGNVSQNTFTNDFSNFGLNNEDGKLWDDMTKSNENAVDTPNPEKVNHCENTSVKKVSEMSSHDSKLKMEDIKSPSMPSMSTKPKLEEDLSESKELNKEEFKSPKIEGVDSESKDVKESKENNPDNTLPGASNKPGREDPGIPYDWATELLKDYVPGDIEASAKMAILFCILEEAMYLGDRLLVFSQSLLTLNLVEDFLQRNELPGRQEKWARNWNYYRLDGSTSAMEREKLINEFNSNPNIHLFLVSTRAGSLGINLVGANRVVVLDASWNPCHDTQAVCRVYRYGQRKPCFVYRLVTDNCLEKKIYDRQINKQGMADRVVDECNPDAHLSIKEVTNLCWDNEEESTAVDFSDKKDKYIDVVMQKVIERYSHFLSKEPFQHESLLVDRKDKKLSSAEKRLAKRSYELEKQASANNTRPAYGYYPGNTGAGRGNPLMKPMASVRPMQSELNNQLIRDASSGRPRQWIPAEVWQKQGMSAQEMTLPLDVVIPTNSPDRSSIVLKAGQKVMVLKSPKGIYMQLENGKIIAIRTAFKVGGKGGDKKGGAASKDTLESGIKKMVVQPTRQRAPASLLPLRNNSNISIIPRGGGGPRGGGPRGPKPLVRFMGARPGLHKQPVAATRPYFGESSSSALPPVTVTVTKKRVPSGSQPPSTSTVHPQVDIRRESKQLTVTPIPPPSPKTAPLGKPMLRISTDSADDSLDAKDESSSDSDSEIPPFDKVECSLEIKPVRNVSASRKEDSSGDGENGYKESDESKTPESDAKTPAEPALPLSVTKDSLNISVEERAKMEPSLQPVVSLKNVRHLSFQSKTVPSDFSGEKPKKSKKSAKVTISPLPFKPGSSLSISPVSSKLHSSKAIELPTMGGSLSIEPVKLPSSTSVNLVKPSVSKTPGTESERKTEGVQETSLSITKIADKLPISATRITDQPPAATSPGPTPTVTDTDSKPETLSTKSGVSPLKPTDKQSSAKSSCSPLTEVQKSSLPVQPKPTTPTPAAHNAFNPAMDLSYRPDYQQFPAAATDFYPGFRPPLGFSPGGFYPPRKDSSGKDIASSLTQFPPFDAASYISSNPFSAAAAGSGYSSVAARASPFNSSSAPAFDSDVSRMYSAFHRPEPHQSSPGFPPPSHLATPPFNPYSYNPFLMQSGFPLPSSNPPPNTPSADPPK